MAVVSWPLLRAGRSITDAHSAAKTELGKVEKLLALDLSKTRMPKKPPKNKKPKKPHDGLKKQTNPNKPIRECAAICERKPRLASRVHVGWAD